MLGGNVSIIWAGGLHQISISMLLCSNGCNTSMCSSCLCNQGVLPCVHRAYDLIARALHDLMRGFLALLSPFAGAGPIPGGVEPPTGDNEVEMSPRSPPPPHQVGHGQCSLPSLTPSCLQCSYVGGLQCTVCGRWRHQRTRKAAARKKMKKKLQEQQRRDAVKLQDPAWVRWYVRYLEHWQKEAREARAESRLLQEYIRKIYEPSFGAATKARGERALHDMQLHDVCFGFRPAYCACMHCTCDPPDCPSLRVKFSAMHVPRCAWLL